MKTVTKWARLKEIEIRARVIWAWKLTPEFLALEKEFAALGGSRGGYVSLFTLAMPDGATGHK